MMNALIKPLAGAMALLGCCMPASADQTVSVGRVDLQLPGDGWHEFPVDDKGVVLSSPGYTYNQNTGSKLIVRPGPDGVLNAVMIARANVSGKGKSTGVIYPNATCKSVPQVYAQGDQGGPGSTSFRCLQVAPVGTITQRPALPGGTQDLLRMKGWRLPPSMFVVSAVQYANTGAFANVLVLLRPLVATLAAEGDGRGVPESLPAGVSPASVQWGRQLQEAVSDSVYSISGNLQVPAFELADTAQHNGTQPAASAASPANSQAPAD